LASAKDLQQPLDTSLAHAVVQQQPVVEKIEDGANVGLGRAVNVAGLLDHALADAIGPVAVAMAATVAGKAGWYQIGGKGVVKAGTVADNASPYMTATPGVLDDAVVAGDRVKGAKFASADGTPSTGLAEIELWRPYVDNAEAA